MRCEAGRTLAEVLVAMLLAVVVGLTLVGLQQNAFRWNRADRQAIAPLGPIRNALDHVARDLRVADQVECCNDQVLTLHQRGEKHLYQITYWLEGERLNRSVMTDYDHGKVSKQTLVHGLKSFIPVVVDNRVRVTVEAESSGPGGVVRRLSTDLVPRLGVMP